MKTPHLPEPVLVHIDRHQGERLYGSSSVYDILSIYLEGGEYYRLNQTTYPARPPFALLIPAGTLDNDLQTGNIHGICLMFNGHGLLQRNPSTEAEMIDIHLPGQICTEPMIKEVDAETAKQLANVLLQVRHPTSPSNASGLLTDLGLIFTALGIYAGARVRDQETEIHREAERLHQLIEETACLASPLDALYGQLDISTAHAQAVFLEAFGIKPVEFRTRLRMAKARELLTTTTMNVSEVAYATGYSDPLYFSKVFKHTFGITPSSMITKFNTRQ